MAVPPSCPTGVETNICWTKIPNSWVMFLLGTFTNPWSHPVFLGPRTPAAQRSPGSPASAAPFGLPPGCPWWCPWWCPPPPNGLTTRSPKIHGSHRTPHFKMDHLGGTTSKNQDVTSGTQLMSMGIWTTKKQDGISKQWWNCQQELGVDDQQTHWISKLVLPRQNWGFESEKQTGRWSFVHDQIQ